MLSQADSIERASGESRTAVACPNLYYLKEREEFGYLGCDGTESSNMNNMEKINETAHRIELEDLYAALEIGLKMQEEEKLRNFYERFKLPPLCGYADSVAQELILNSTLSPDQRVRLSDSDSIDHLSDEEVLLLERLLGCGDLSLDNGSPSFSSSKPSSSSSSPSCGSQDSSRQATDAFIQATTKACPRCSMRATHYHGHACHHISPGVGCPGCGTHYCYKCCSTADENSSLRGNEKSCLCGFWSSFCGTFRTAKDIKDYLVCVPYPHDSRCGCAICPDCRENAPCSLCSGHCDVCCGNINPGPSELNGLEWTAQSEKSRKRMQIENIIEHLTSLCITENLSVLKEAIEESSVDIDSCDSSGRTLLHHACSSGGGKVTVIRLLVEEFHAKLDVRNSFGTTPLHYACSNGHTEAVVYLLNHIIGTNHTPHVCHSLIFPQDNEQKTPLFYASFRGYFEIVQSLVRMAATNSGDNKDGFQIVRGLCEIVDLTGWTALHCAAFGGHTDIVRHLFCSIGVNGNILTKNGKSVLHIAMEKGFVDIVRILAQSKGTEVNVQDSTMSTPLHYACSAGHAECVKALMDLTRDSKVELLLSLQNKFGKTAFHYACERGFVDVIGHFIRCDTLINSKTVNARSSKGLTALHLALMSDNETCGQVLHLLLFSKEGETFRKYLDRSQMIGALVLSLRRGHWKAASGIVPLTLLLSATFSLFVIIPTAIVLILILYKTDK